jgi:hypothetical protein
MIDSIDAVGLISDKIDAEGLVVQFLATGFLGNMTVHERAKFAYMTDTRLRAMPCFMWRLAV